jgi:FkbM family methyltransferase
MSGYSLINNVVTIKQCKYGMLAFFNSDAPIGSCLKAYGEWAEEEIKVFKQILTPTSHVIDVGANIGSHTVFFSKFCNKGLVYAIEPQFYIFQLLVANSVLNGCFNVKHFNAAISNDYNSLKLINLPPASSNNINYGEFKIHNDENGIETKCLTIDSMELTHLDLIKVDVEGHEMSVIESAIESIKKFKPYLYVEFNNSKGNKELLETISKLGYNIYIHIANKFTPDNYNNVKTNIWLDDQTITPNDSNIHKFFEGNILCVPKTNKNFKTNLVKIKDFDINFVDYLKNNILPKL